MRWTRFEKRQQIVATVHSAAARLINANALGDITAAGLNELAWPEAIEHMSPDGQVAASQGQKCRSTQYGFRLRYDVIVHQQDMRRAAAALSFEKRARKSAGPAAIRLFDKLQSTRRFALQRGERWMVAHPFRALINNNDALKEFSDIRIGQNGRDIA